MVVFPLFGGASSFPASCTHKTTLNAVAQAALSPDSELVYISALLIWLSSQVQILPEADGLVPSGCKTIRPQQYSPLTEQETNSLLIQEQTEQSGCGPPSPPPCGPRIICSGRATNRLSVPHTTRPDFHHTGHSYQLYTCVTSLLTAAVYWTQNSVFNQVFNQDKCCFWISDLLLRGSTRSVNWNAWKLHKDI